MTSSAADSGSVHEQFDAFVTRRYAALVRFGYVLTGDRAGAEDLVQTALFLSFRRWARLADPADPVAYVRRTMVNAQISWSRRLSSRERLLAEPTEAEEYTSGGHEDGREVERLYLWSQLGSLPVRMRAVLVLRFYEDLSEAETAGVLGCSVGTVKSQTSRGLARLRRTLDDAGPEPASSPESARPVAAQPAVSGSMSARMENLE